MREWAEIDKDKNIIRIVMMDKVTPLEDYKWLIKNLGGNWKINKQT